MNVISKKPTFDTDGYGTVGFGSKNERIVTGAIGGALVDERLAGRVALYSEERDGFQSNDFDGNTYGDVNKKAIRLQFLAQLNPDLDALLKLHSRRFKGDGSNGSLPVGRYYNVGYARKNTRITGLDDVGSIPGNQIIGRNTQGLIEDGTPEDKLTLSANWLYDGWSVTVAQRRYGEWKNRNAANPTLDQTFSPQWVTDLDVSYRFDLGLTLSAGAINLFDSHPDKAKGAQLYGVPKYSITSPEGAQGAFYYTSVSYDF
ncbi:TonB-dependent receptor [Pseudomonas monteilii]|nr:TonB-dependent receptor [Pseudomonas sp. LTGT-11-2Z]